MPQLHPLIFYPILAISFAVPPLSGQTDSFEGADGNNSAGLAAAPPSVAGSGGRSWSVAATLHDGADVDWYRLEPTLVGDFEVILLDGTPGEDTTLNLEASCFDSEGVLRADLQRGLNENPRTSGAVVTLAGEPLLIRVKSPGGAIGPYRLEVAAVDQDEFALSRINRFQNERIPLSIPEQRNGFLSGPLRSFVLPGLGEVTIDPDRDRYEIPLATGEGMFVRVEARGQTPTAALMSVLQRSNQVSQGGTYARVYSVRPASGGRDALLEVSASNEREIGDYTVSVRPFDDFDQWVVDEFLPVYDYGDDRNGDGLPIGLVWALDLGIDTDYRESLQPVRLASGDFRFEVPAARASRRRDVIIQKSSDLTNWMAVSGGAVSTGSAVIAAGSQAKVVVTLSPDDDEACYFRLSLKTE